jgi:hypothetical protein
MNKPVIASNNDDRRYGGSSLPTGFDEYINTFNKQQFSGKAFALYEDTGGMVKKYAEWNGDCLVADIMNAQESMQVEQKGSDRIQEVNSYLQNIDIKSAGSSLDDETESRLEKLGYL